MYHYILALSRRVALWYNRNMNEHSPLVAARVIIGQFGIPHATLYRLVNRGIIPCHEQPRQPWHTRRRLLFSLSEVAEALANMHHPNT